MMMKLCTMLCVTLFLLLPNVEASPTRRVARLTAKATALQAKASALQSKTQATYTTQTSASTTTVTTGTVQPATLGAADSTSVVVGRYDYGRGGMVYEPSFPKGVAGTTAPSPRLSTKVIESRNSKPEIMEVRGSEADLIKFHETWQTALWPDWRDHLNKKEGTQIARDYETIKEGAKSGSTLYAVSGKIMEDAFQTALSAVNR